MATGGEIRWPPVGRNDGHQWGIKWPPVGRNRWPLTRARQAAARFSVSAPSVKRHAPAERAMALTLSPSRVERLIWRRRSGPPAPAPDDREELRDSLPRRQSSVTRSPGRVCWRQAGRARRSARDFSLRPRASSPTLATVAASETCARAGAERIGQAAWDVPTFRQPPQPSVASHVSVHDGTSRPPAPPRHPREARHQGSPPRALRVSQILL